MKLLVGLWNPEKKYFDTRHNLGARAALAWYNSRENTSLTQHDILEKMRDGGAVLETRVGREKVFVLFPSTYMNDSGRDVSAFVRMRRIPLQNICLVHDDKDMQVGKLRFVPFEKVSGSGGHNGVKSVFASLGTDHLARYKLGVANEHVQQSRISTADFVLGKFTTGEKKEVIPSLLDTFISSAQKHFF